MKIILYPFEFRNFEVIEKLADLVIDLPGPRQNADLVIDKIFSLVRSTKLPSICYIESSLLRHDRRTQRYEYICKIHNIDENSHRIVEPLYRRVFFEMKPQYHWSDNNCIHYWIFKKGGNGKEYLT